MNATPLMEKTIFNLRRIADNLDAYADLAERQGHLSLVRVLRNNAACLRRAADKISTLEATMGQFADKIHKLESDVAAARLAAQKGQQAQITLDALQAAGKIADDADIAALADPDPAPPDASPAPAPAPAETPAVPAPAPVT